MDREDLPDPDAIDDPPPPRPPEIAETLIETIEPIARRTSAGSVLVYADILPESGLPLSEALRERVICVSRTPDEEKVASRHGFRSIRVPNVSLSRFAKIKIALLIALSRNLVTPNEVIVCLTGGAGSSALDTLTVLRVRDVFESLLEEEELDPDLSSDVHPEVLERVVNIAAQLGSEGREGKPVGALFVLGDSERVLSLSKQLILNPFRGYPEEKRNILDASLEETVKELSVIDGAFVIRRDGIVESAGTYLKPASQKEFDLPPGLGARHQAAAAITHLTDSIAVTVSESTGTVTIFRDGHIVAELEKPRFSARHLPRPTADEG